MRQHALVHRRLRSGARKVRFQTFAHVVGGKDREAAGLGQIEGLGESAQFDAGDLQIDPMLDRIDLDAR